jgi:uridine kinase
MNTEQKNFQKPYIVSIVGGTASGKTTFTEKLKSSINEKITHFGMDNFYIGIPKNINPDDYDFDHPSSLDFDYIVKCTKELVTTGKTEIPIYDFKTHSRVKDKKQVLIADRIIIFEGILCLHDERIRDLFDLKIFIHCDPDIALGRRILRDIAERGRDVNEVLTRYNRFIKPGFEKFVKPQMKMVDLIIPGGASNDIALNFVLENMMNKMKKSSLDKNLLVEQNEFQRTNNNRKLSVNTLNKLNMDNSIKKDKFLGKVVMDNHIPFSKELRQTAKVFFQQLYSNPDASMLKMNMKYFSQLAREDILNAMSSDFQMTNEQVTKLIIKVRYDCDPKEIKNENKQSRKIYFIRKRSILKIDVAKQLLNLLRVIDNFPVYIHCDFINPQGLSLICKNSPNTHLFSLYYIESADEFLDQLSPEVTQLLL